MRKLVVGAWLRDEMRKRKSEVEESDRYQRLSGQRTEHWLQVLGWMQQVVQTRAQVMVALTVVVALIWMPWLLERSLQMLRLVYNRLIDKYGLLIKLAGSMCYPIVEVLELAVLFDRSMLLYQ